MIELQKFMCAACKREFISTREDVESAAGHLCIAADRGLSQAEGLKEIRESGKPVER